MKIYKLIQTYPNSPELGYVTNSAKSEYYSIKPQNYPHLWEELPKIDGVTTANGVFLNLGDFYWYIYKYSIAQSTVNEYTTSTYHIYSNYEEALKDLYKQINVEIEDGIIVKEDIPIYGVLEDCSQYRETTSYQLWLSEQRGGKRSNKWKFFKTIEERDYYVEWNAKKYSKKEMYEYFHY